MPTSPSGRPGGFVSSVHSHLDITHLSQAVEKDQHLHRVNHSYYLRALPGGVNHSLEDSGFLFWLWKDPITGFKSCAKQAGSDVFFLPLERKKKKASLPTSHFHLAKKITKQRHHQSIELSIPPPPEPYARDPAHPCVALREAYQRRSSWPKPQVQGAAYPRTREGPLCAPERDVSEFVTTVLGASQKRERLVTWGQDRHVFSCQ